MIHPVSFLHLLYLSQDCNDDAWLWQVNDYGIRVAGLSKSRGIPIFLLFIFSMKYGICPFLIYYKINTN